MKLPDHIEAEIGKGRRVGEYVDHRGFPVPSEGVPDFARRIAGMVAKDCAQTCDDDFERKAIRERYGLDKP